MQCLTTPIRWEDGYVIPPTEPGLGFELNDEFIVANPYSDSALHLNLDTNPIVT